MHRIIPLIFTALLIAGCSQAPIETPLATATLPAVKNDWTIQMTQSGGIMGLLRTIEIKSDGEYTVTDERANQTVTGKLSADKRQRLNELVSSVEDLSGKQIERNICADCFVYDLELRINDKNFAVQLNDINLPDSGFEPLVTELRNIIDSSLK